MRGRSWAPPGYSGPPPTPQQPHGPRTAGLCPPTPASLPAAVGPPRIYPPSAGERKGTEGGCSRCQGAARPPGAGKGKHRCSRAVPKLPLLSQVGPSARRDGAAREERSGGERCLCQATVLGTEGPPARRAPCLRARSPRTAPGRAGSAGGQRAGREPAVCPGRTGRQQHLWAARTPSQLRRPREGIVPRTRHS